MDAEIAPEPTEAERAVLAAFLREDDDRTPKSSQSAWARAALEEAAGADEEAYGSAPVS